MDTESKTRFGVSCTLSGLFLLGGGSGGLTRPGVVLAAMLPVLVLMLNGLPVTAVGEDWWFILRDRVVLVLAVGLSTSSSVGDAREPGFEACERVV